MAHHGPTHMEAEIRQTPDAVALLLDVEGASLRALGQKLRELDPKVIVTCARGSSDNAAAYFKYLSEILGGVPVASIGPSVASLYKAPLKLAGAVVVSVSQSGQSPDIVALQQAARQAGAFSIAVVNQAGSPLADEADAVVPLHAGVESSVAATKSCIGSMVALAAILAEWQDDAALRTAVRNLPDAFASALRTSWAEAMPAFLPAQSAYVIGRGPALPAAAEAALKLKETAVLHAEAFSGAEVMHGPLQLLQRDFPVIAFCQEDASRDAMFGSVARLRAAQGRVFAAAPVALAGAAHLPVHATGHPMLDPLSTLLTFYSFAEALARARGHDPDRPNRLRKVTETI